VSQNNEIAANITKADADRWRNQGISLKYPDERTGDISTTDERSVRTRDKEGKNIETGEKYQQGHFPPKDRRDEQRDWIGQERPHKNVGMNRMTAVERHA